MSTNGLDATTVTDRRAGGGDQEFKALLERLGNMSVRDYYNPYLEFEWPHSLPERQYWMSPELLSVAGTELADELSTAQLHVLSKWESLNFYSLNVHGIRELLIAVTQRIHTRGFETPSEFFHHFLGEENEHMWFFARFCRNYGRIYPRRQSMAEPAADAGTENFLVFARILIFEEIVDHYNIKMASDDRLHTTIRQVNRIHHQDESRHIAFGRKIVGLLYGDVARADGAASAVEDYLKRYMAAMVRSFYNPAVYRDAGIPVGQVSPSQLPTHPGRRKAHTAMLRRSTNFFLKEGIFTNADIAL